jgi:hypothetical protein
VANELNAADCRSRSVTANDTGSNPDELLLVRRKHSGVVVLEIPEDLGKLDAGACRPSLHRLRGTGQQVNENRFGSGSDDSVGHKSMLLLEVTDSAAGLRPE